MNSAFTRGAVRAVGVLAAVVALAWAAVAGPAVAAAGDWGPPVTLSDSGQDAIVPQVVTDGSTITAVWQSFDVSNDFFKIQSASSSDGGVTWGAPVTLSDSGQDAYDAQVVTDGSTITASWRRFDGSYYRVQSASSTDGGVTWGVPVMLSDPGQNAINPKVVTDGSTITAVWQRYDGSNSRVQSASSTDGGVTWGVPVTLSDSGQNAYGPQVVTNGSTITAVWFRSDGSYYRVQSASSTDGGVTWGVPVTLSDSGQFALDPQVVTDGITITAVWYRSDGTKNRVQSASSTDGGITWGVPVTLSEPGQDALGPQVVTNGSTITAIWYRFDGSNNRVQSASSLDGGATWGVPVTLSEPGQDALGPQVVTDGITITAAWSRSDGSIYRVQSASSTDGGVTWSVPVMLSDPGQDAFDPQVVTDGSTITAVWYRSDGSNTRVQASSFTAATPELADTGIDGALVVPLGVGGSVLVAAGLATLLVMPRRSVYRRARATH